MLCKLTHEYIWDLKAYRRSPSNSTELFMGVFVNSTVYTTLLCHSWDSGVEIWFWSYVGSIGSGWASSEKTNSCQPIGMSRWPNGRRLLKTRGRLPPWINSGNINRWLFGLEMDSTTLGHLKIRKKSRIHSVLVRLSWEISRPYLTNRLGDQNYFMAWMIRWEWGECLMVMNKK